MNEEIIKKRIDTLLASESNEKITVRSRGMFHGALNIMIILYGANSIQVETFTKESATIREKLVGDTGARLLIDLVEGALLNMKAELEAGIVGSLQKTITGGVLTDFLQLARAALAEKGDNAKNVAAVLAASLFEDTIRRIAISNGIPHVEKLQDVINELKTKEILQGSQVGIALSYLNFRNNSLHAQWDKVEREAVASVLGFVEQLLIRYFTQ